MPGSPAADPISSSTGVRRGRRGSSEDDLPLRLNHAPNDGGGRGLNPPPDERGPAVNLSMGMRGPTPLEQLQIGNLRQVYAEVDDGVQAPVRGRFRQRRPCLRSELAQRRFRMTEAELGDLDEVRRQRIEAE